MAKPNEPQLWLQEKVVFMPGACGGTRMHRRIVSSLDRPAAEEGVTRTEVAPEGATPCDWEEVK